MDEHCYVEFFYTGCKLSAEILEKLMLSKMSKYSQILNIDHNDTLDQGWRSYLTTQRKKRQ